MNFEKELLSCGESGDHQFPLECIRGLLRSRCIICMSSESRGRVAGWSLWRFMAPSPDLNFLLFLWVGKGGPWWAVTSTRTPAGGPTKKLFTEIVPETNGFRECTTTRRQTKMRKTEANRGTAGHWMAPGLQLGLQRQSKKNYERLDFTGAYLSLRSTVMK